MNNFTNKLYILTEHNETYQQLILQQALPDLEITENAAEADIVLAAPPVAAERLNEFTKLDWLQSTYAGINALVAPHLRQDYTLTNVRGIFGPLIAEYVLGYSISHYRHFQHYHQQQTQKQWQPQLYQSLSGRTMVILGTGSIGSHLAKVAQAFGIRAIGVNRTGIPPRQTSFDNTYHINEAHVALKQADIVVNTLPSTPQTTKLLNSDLLSHCQGALLFNVGRGDTLDDAGLLLALKNRWIAHAFLDVFESEPLPQEHPFWGLPQITITPHIAALSEPRQVIEIFASNYHSWRDGFQLQYQIDFDKGY
ncbi:D-2-hydroxyacid dehydrogenase [Vibrio sp. D404a]|uniref:D-2-hydroxyacid dehydrogenase n=1 Tax=unclassified Vibrio TaxID=2614977 RepID=UPI0025526C1A|nr:MULTISPECIES: D-2-hydroxyacid dehydrogenase [unclassified Vibrio]MDK9739997.1 D-2-hydroxyacid dehydrogenase [Vibrio sp. D404a]MDK9799460.1 D-2-hydroxyacid dehydrogenase [Vibrio sp. D449a]